MNRIERIEKISSYFLDFQVSTLKYEMSCEYCFSLVKCSQRYLVNNFRPRSVLPIGIDSAIYKTRSRPLHFYLLFSVIFLSYFFPDHHLFLLCHVLLSKKQNRTKNRTKKTPKGQILHVIRWTCQHIHVIKRHVHL